jgi:hypothetical protein
MAGTDEEAAIVAKYRATEQFRNAWEIISPNIPEHRSKCENEIVYAILVVRFAKFGARRGNVNKKHFLNRAKKLRAAEAAVYFSVSLIDDLKREREALERMASSFSAGKGKPQRSKPKQIAVGHARELLRFGNKRPSLYRDGSWHELAKILFNEDGVDLFEYLERYSPRDADFWMVAPDGGLMKLKKFPLGSPSRMG